MKNYEEFGKESKINLYIKFLSILFVIIGVSAETDTLDTIKTVHFKIGHTLNLRDPIDDSNIVDWHVAAHTSILFDSLMGLEAELKGSYERDNGRLFYAHAEKLGFKYGYIGYIEDTEDSIRLFNISAFYPFLKYFKAGIDLSWKYGEDLFGAYLGFNSSFGFLEIVFWNDLRRIKAELTPKIQIGKKKILTMGIKADALYLGKKKIDWNAGYLIEFKIDK